MSPAPIADYDPKLDLVLERTLDVPRNLVWDAWTKPEHLKNWFTPAPWTVADCVVDLRPGGAFRTVMRGPDGEESTVNGCFLEVVPNERLVWTEVLLPGFRPAHGSFMMTAVVSMQDEGSGTRYVARAIHSDEQAQKQHEEMGFYDGWGTVADQMVAYIKASLQG